MADLIPWKVRVSPPERTKILLLTVVAILIVAYLVRVRPMQSETDEILANLESEAPPSLPSVPIAAAAYVNAPERALPEFYATMEGFLHSSGLKIDSRQARIEANPQEPAAQLIYECRARGQQAQVVFFLSAVRAAQPRIQIRRLTLHRLEKPQDVEIFFEARALAMAVERTG